MDFKEVEEALYPVFKRSAKYADGCFYYCSCGGYYLINKVERSYPIHGYQLPRRTAITTKAYGFR